MKSVRITISTKGVVRRFLSFAAAKDGSVYSFLGYKPTSAASYSSEISIPGGQTSASVDYTTQPKRQFEDVAGHHIGLKASGLGLAKAGTRYGKGLKMSRLAPLPAAPSHLPHRFKSDLS
jgi:hypothetical protein